MKRALITGITGQDGAYLSKLLIENGYEVFGACRGKSSPNLWRLDELGITNQIKLVHLDLIELSNIINTLKQIRPHEIYNLAAQSFVSTSFEQPLYTTEVDALGTTRILEAIRMINPEIRFYQASSSEMFGMAQESPQTEKTPFYPRSPYAAAKAYAHWITVNYREAYKIHASSGILFNHESPLRGAEFVTRKITIGLSKIVSGQQEFLELGNLEAKRDWGFAGDYTQGMWMMTQQPEADTYILATGKNRSIKEFVEKSAEHLGFSIRWEGSGKETIGIHQKTGKTIIRVNPHFFRPTEVDAVIGDATKAAQKLGWKSKVDFENLVQKMVEADFNRVKSGRYFE